MENKIVSCPISADEITNLQSLLDQQGIEMEIQAGVSDFVTLQYEDRIELIEGNLQLDDKKKALCGGDLSLKLETEHSFFSHDAGSSTLFLESTENTREGEY